jgi:BirA family biotin operon repressor/biotin-[acetyl-CoA-carboxylase] ligase
VVSGMAYQPTGRHLNHLLQLLAENATVVVPGPRIAEEIGVSGARVWQYVERLRALGVDIKGRPSSGYHLERLPDLLLPGLLRPELGGLTFGHRVVHYFKTVSTNTDALQLAVSGAPHGTLVVAEQQTGGRGRFGRTWHSEYAKGIYASLILRPALPPSAAPIMTLMAGVAVHELLREITRLPFDIRWPNDVLTGGKKVCGILTELSADLDRIHAVVVGIGINVNHSSMPEELRGIATSLSLETHRAWPRIQLLSALMRELESLYDQFMSQGNRVVLERWAAASSFARGRRVRVTENTTQRSGTTTGLDSNGALRVQFDDGEERPLVSGEVMELKPEELAAGRGSVE